MRIGSARALGRVAPAAAAVLVGLAAAWFGVRAFGQETSRLGPFAVEMSSRFGRGQTVIALPPLGEIRVDTHGVPLGVRATLVDVDIEQLAADLEDGSVTDVAAAVEADARSRVRPFSLKLVGVAALGGVVAGVIVFRRRWRLAAVAAASSIVVVGSCLAATATTFRTDAFAEPRFVGTLRLAPELLGPAQEFTQRLDQFRANLERIVRGSIRAYSALEPQAIGGGDELRVLHISDVHLNTVGLDFAVQLARGFDVDVVLDTGDLTSYGTPLEEAIVSQLPRFGRPYVFVRGNHDPPAVGERIAATENGRVLEGEMTAVRGLRIYGEPHPVYTEESDVDPEALEAGAREAGPGLRSAVEALDETPDVVAVHDDRMASELAGHVPVVLSGHFHRARVETREGTLFLRAGSTGGAGVNMFAGTDPVPLSATILYFERTPANHLIAYDLVQQSPTTGRLTIQRHLVADAPEATSSPGPDEPSPEPAGPSPGP